TSSSVIWVIGVISVDGAASNSRRRVHQAYSSSQPGPVLMNFAVRDRRRGVKNIEPAPVTRCQPSISSNYTIGDCWRGARTPDSSQININAAGYNADSFDLKA